MSRRTFEMMEQREELFIKSNYMCEVCGKSLFAYGTPQLAHRIPQRKHLIEIYGKEIIHNKLNMKPTCCLECNAKVSTGYNFNEILEVLLEIRDSGYIEGLDKHIESLQNKLEQNGHTKILLH